MLRKSRILAWKQEDFIATKSTHQSRDFGDVSCEDIESGVSGENVGVLLLRLSFSQFGGATGAHRQVEDFVAANVHVARLGVQCTHLKTHTISNL